MSDPALWTTPAQIKSKVLRRWSSGALLRDFAAGEDLEPFDIPLRGPGSADLGEHYAFARAWARQIEEASQRGGAYVIVNGSIGGRGVGRTEVPKRAVLSSYEQVWTLLGVRKSVAAYGELLAETAGWAGAGTIRPEDSNPVLGWARSHPIKALELAEQWTRILAAWQWLEANRGSGAHLRQITARGVDSKFVESHLGPLSQMLGVPASRSGFESALGLASKPGTVRLRFDAGAFGFPRQLSEAELRVDELNSLAAQVERVLIVENEVTFLSLPVPFRGVVVWGRGYDVGRAASVSWMQDAAVVYWGDLDTHGFAILNRLRAHVRHARSVLMDRATLLLHEDRWGSEPRPSSALLSGLTRDEASLYGDLVSNRYGPAIRLEQERVDWAWAEQCLEAELG